MKRLCLCLPVLVLLIASCSKNGSFPTSPDLTFKTITPQEVHNGDSIQVVCSFRDKEGDLQDSIFYRPNSLLNNAGDSGVFGDYQIPNFPTHRNLEGDIILVLYGGLDYQVPIGGASDTLYFDIFIKDRAGHSSDTVKTTPVVVFGD